MHITRSVALTAAIAAVGAALPATAGARPIQEGPQDIVEIVVGNSNFDTLESLLQQAGLVETLQGRGPFTVFAPTDAAFERVPQSTLDALAQDPDQLRAVLLYHVAQGRRTARRVVNTRSIKTVNGKRVRVRVRGSRVSINNARVTRTNIRASNGVIHVINRVLIPPR